MPKQKTTYVCQECGYDTPGFLGKCPECGAWNSLKEIKIHKSQSITQDFIKNQPQKLSQIKSTDNIRIDTGLTEFNNVLGGGIVRGGAILLAGDPGVGKSTLLLKVCMNLSLKNKVLYVSGEESIEQIKLRAERMISGPKERIEKYDNLSLLSSVDIDEVSIQIENQKPDLVVVDSIQTMESANTSGLSGSIPQIRYSALSLIRIAKRNNIPVIMVGHVTKEGNVAGPMLLSHMVDVVLFLEGEKLSSLRIARIFKNRFGPVDEVGVFVMNQSGLDEVSDPSGYFVKEERKNNIGSVLTVTIEGNRAFLIEIQVLAVSSRLPMPQRVASGVDRKRVELLLAVMKKYCNLNTDSYDIFINIAGGIKISDPGIDLAICIATYSSIKQTSFGKIVCFGEVGLLGELREVYHQDKRIKEVMKFGYKNILSAKDHKDLFSIINKLEKKDAK